MPEAGGSAAGNARLSDLESRWRFDRSPRVFLQLADELRRTGAVARAIEVLQEGLSHHPESVSGRVALGRAQLEAGDASSAAMTFERVLTRDPAQIVASKLLIETWIRMGDAARARERLDIYRILQERDGEIDDYERRIAAMERSERMPAVFELAGASAPARAELPTAAPSAQPVPQQAAEPLFDLGAARELPPLELVPEVASSTDRSLSEAAATRQGSASGAVSQSFDLRTPFGVIHEPEASGARILGFFRSEAVFAMPPIAEPRAAAVAEAPQEVAAEAVGIEPVAIGAEPVPSVSAIVPEVAAMPSEPLVSEPIADQAAIEPLFGSTLESALEPAASSELAPGMTFEQFSTTGFAAEVERDSLVEPLADVLSRAGIDAEALPAISHPAEAGLLEPEVARPIGVPVELANRGIDDTLETAAVGAESRAGEETPFAAAAAVRPPEAPSATLARLYLDQGHFAEAEAEFRRVVEARPNDDSALAGLREVTRRRASDETVSGWGAVAPVEPAMPRVHRSVGLTQRKVETLRAYLERIRRARARANVS